MTTDSGNAALQELRQKLDQVDEEIVRLIARRLETVGLIGKEKAGRTQGLRDPERERAVLSKVESVAAQLGVSGPLARKIFSEIINHSLSKQAAALSTGARELSIVYQGSPGTYNQLAAEKYVSESGKTAR